MILMLGIVAVLHIGSHELAEADCKGDRGGTVCHASNAIDVLAGPFFPLGRGLSVA